MSVQEEVGDFGQIVFDPEFLLGVDDPANFVPNSQATIVFGGTDLNISMRGRLLLPAPLTITSTFGTRSAISNPGDYNDDSLMDIAVAVFRESPADPNQLFDAVAADSIITGEFLGDQLFGLGDITGDGYHDFAISRTREGAVSATESVLIYDGNVHTNASQQRVNDVFRANLTVWGHGHSSIVDRVPVSLNGMKRLISNIPRRAAIIYGTALTEAQTIRIGLANW